MSRSQRPGKFRDTVAPHQEVDRQHRFGVMTGLLKHGGDELALG
jgi:hypothetical protein